MLLCALGVVPILFAIRVSSLWAAVGLISLGFSPNPHLGLVLPTWFLRKPRGGKPWSNAQIAEYLKVPAEYASED